MATKKSSTTKKSTPKSSKDKWATTGGSLKPVDLSKIEWANKPTKK